MPSSLQAPVDPPAPATSRSGGQAFRLLHAAFTLLPILAGADKFLHWLVNWDLYLAPAIAQLSPVGAHGFMLAVGVIEIVAGLVVAFRPRFGGYLVAAWLWGIIINLLLAGGYSDIALRDFGLSLGALALARLAEDRAAAADESLITAPIRAGRM